MTRGESWELNGYTIVFEGLAAQQTRGEANVTTAALGIYENGQRITTLLPGISFYERQQQQVSDPAIWHDAPFFRRDLYVIVQGWSDGFQTVSFRAFVNPLVTLVWIGGIMFLFASVITMFPDPGEQRARERARREIPAGGVATPSE